MENRKIMITTEYITLQQFMKWANIVQSGGEAKKLIGAGSVFVNGERETRNGRKLYPHDLVKVTGKGEFTVEREQA